MSTVSSSRVGRAWGRNGGPRVWRTQLRNFGGLAVLQGHNHCWKPTLGENRTERPILLSPPHCVHQKTLTLAPRAGQNGAENLDRVQSRGELVPGASDSVQMTLSLICSFHSGHRYLLPNLHLFLSLG